MNTARRHRRFASWLAIVAIAAMALLPALSHALAQPSGSLAEICTAQGKELVAADEGRSLPAGGGLHLEHCPYCGLGGAAGLPPAVAQLAVPAAEAAAPLQPSLPAPRLQPTWPAASPRAPPLRA